MPEIFHKLSFVGRHQAAPSGESCDQQLTPDDLWCLSRPETLAGDGGLDRPVAPLAFQRAADRDGGNRRTVLDRRRKHVINPLVGDQRASGIVYGHIINLFSNLLQRIAHRIHPGLSADHHIDIQERRRIKTECDKAGLPIISICCVAVGLIDFNPSVQRFHIDRCHAFLDLCYEYEADNLLLVLGEYIWNQEVIPPAEQWATGVENCRELAEYAENL